MSVSVAPARAWARVPVPWAAVRFVEGVGLLALGALALLVLGFALLPSVFGLRVLVVTGGSMRPAFVPGDVLLVDRVGGGSTVVAGDMIAFRPAAGSSLTTHRVADIKEIDGATYFQTKGDANPSADPDLVARAAVYGRVAHRLPVLGYLLDLVNQPGPRALLLFLPAALLALQELVLALRTPAPAGEPAPAG